MERVLQKKQHSGPAKAIPTKEVDQGGTLDHNLLEIIKQPNIGYYYTGLLGWWEQIKD